MNWEMAKWHLQCTEDGGIMYMACEHPVVGYSDASWNVAEKGHTHNAFVFTLSRGAISSKTMKQREIALSACETEFIAITGTIDEGNQFKTVS